MNENLCIFSFSDTSWDQIANIHWIIEKARELQKNIYFWFIDYAKAFDCVDRNKLWKILKEMATWPASWEICKQVKKQQLELAPLPRVWVCSDFFPPSHDWAHH